MNESYEVIYSLGIRCYSELAIKKLNKRKFSSVFGSLNIKNFENIIECINTNFNILLDRKQIISASDIPDMTEEVKNFGKRILHRGFDDMNDYHSSTIPHHDIRKQKDWDHFQRTIERFDKLRKNNIPTLFLNTSYVPEYINTTIPESERIIHVLKSTGWSKFHVLFVYFTEGPETKITKLFADKYKSIYGVTALPKNPEKDVTWQAPHIDLILKEFDIGKLINYQKLDRM